MTSRQKKRLVIVAVIAIGMSAATALALYAFQQNLLYFYSPSEVIAGSAPEERLFRIGGLVVDGSVAREADGLTVRFSLTDRAATIPVVYTGLLPDLFREGQGIIAHGRMNQDGIFHASEVLAKHDETYMPPEVADALKTAEGKPAYTPDRQP